MAAPLSYRMQDNLREIGKDWQKKPIHASRPEIEALQKRGLIETRGFFYDRDTFRVRLTPAASEGGAND